MEKEEKITIVKQLPISSDGLRRMRNRIWVPMLGGLRDVIMEEAHKSKYLMHPRADKMYHILKDHY
jgi:hypothetical protein